jgi:hypothetical protein
MAKTLTVFILHCGDDLRHNPEKTAKSVVNPLTTTITLVQPGFRDLNALVPTTDWKMFLFSDEWLSNQLVEVLPIYLGQETFNVLSAFRMVEPVKGQDLDDLEISLCPRLFASDVRLKNFAFEWDMEEGSIHHSKILDGFIIGARL